MSNLVYTVRDVRKTVDTATNISAAVSILSENNTRVTFARGYILSKRNGRVLDIYGGLKNATQHFGELFQKMLNGDLAYLITFISGNIKEKEKDLFCYPFRYSTSDPLITKAEPFIVKNGVRMPWQMFQEGEHHLILGDEERHRRTRPFEEYSKTFPALIDIEYGPDINLVIQKLGD